MIFGNLLLLRRIVDARAVHEPARLPRVEALERIDVETHEGVRALLRDLLDLDSALRREHEQRLLDASIEGQREVVLLRDVRRRLDPEPAHDVALDVQPEDVFACSSASCGVVASLTPPALPRPPVSTCALTTTGPPSTSAACAPPLVSSPAGRRRRESRPVETAPCPDTRTDPLAASLPAPSRPQ